MTEVSTQHYLAEKVRSQSASGVVTKLAVMLLRSHSHLDPLICLLKYNRLFFSSSFFFPNYTQLLKAKQWLFCECAIEARSLVLVLILFQ